jgi:hypothetical protein
MSTVRRLAGHQLDDLPRRCTLPDSFAPRWAVKLPYGPRTHLSHYRDAVVLLNNRNGVVAVGEDAPDPTTFAPWPVYAVADMSDPYKAWCGGSVVLQGDARRQLLTWEPHEAPRAVPSIVGPGEGPGELSAQALGDDQLLVLRYVDEDQNWLSLRDRQSAKEHWSVHQGSFPCLAVDGMLLSPVWLATSDLQGRSATDGVIRWTLDVKKAGAQAVVDDLVWLATVARLGKRGELIAVDAAAGRIVHSVVTDTWAPFGQVDESGILHVLQGIQYFQYDLRAGAVRRAAMELPLLGEDGPRTAKYFMLANDGRILYADEGAPGTVWVVRTDGSALTRVFRGSRRISGLAASAGTVFVLEEGGLLTALGGAKKPTG